MAQTQVDLISHTSHPMETLWCIWAAGKSRDELESPGTMVWTDEKIAAVKNIIDSQMPITENIDFIFSLSHVPIALREQMVRHRIGIKFGQNYGVDIIPELHDSSWWAQSMRILDMGSFAKDQEYHVPEWLDRHGGERMPGTEISKLEFYHRQMAWIQAAYTRMMKAGFPIDDARNIIPLAATHRITWHINLKALLYVIGRRGCWLLQLGLWEPVIRGVVQELANRVHPMFRRVIDPPCFQQGRWVGCQFVEQNATRLRGEDPNPPCSLFLYQHQEEVKGILSDVAEGSPWNVTHAKQYSTAVHRTDSNKTDLYAHMQSQYRNLWHRDPCTGVPLTVHGKSW